MGHKYSDDEWLSLITECRTSGIPQRHWCREHHISLTAYYEHIKDLIEKGFSVPNAGPVTTASRQEIVEVTGQACTKQEPSADQHCAGPALSDTAVRLVFKGIPLEITNMAAGSTLTNVLKALEEVC